MEDARINFEIVYSDTSVLLSENPVSVTFEKTTSCVSEWVSFKEVSKEGSFVFSKHSELIAKHSEEITLNKLKDRKKIPKEIKTIIKKLEKDKKKEQKRICRMGQKRKREEDITPNLTSLHTSYSPNVKIIEDSEIYEIFADLENDDFVNFCESEFSQNDDFVNGCFISQTSSSWDVETMNVKSFEDWTNEELLISKTSYC